MEYKAIIHDGYSKVDNGIVIGETVAFLGSYGELIGYCWTDVTCSLISLWMAVSLCLGQGKVFGLGICRLCNGAPPRRRKVEEKLHQRNLFYFLRPENKRRKQKKNIHKM